MVRFEDVWKYLKMLEDAFVDVWKYLSMLEDALVDAYLSMSIASDTETTHTSTHPFSPLQRKAPTVTCLPPATVACGLKVAGASRTKWCRK